MGFNFLNHIIIYMIQNDDLFKKSSKSSKIYCYFIHFKNLKNYSEASEFISVETASDAFNFASASAFLALASSSRSNFALSAT